MEREKKKQLAQAELMKSFVKSRRQRVWEFLAKNNSGNILSNVLLSSQVMLPHTHTPEGVCVCELERERVMWGWWQRERGVREKRLGRFCLVGGRRHITQWIAIERGMLVFVKTFAVMSSVLSLAPPGQESEEEPGGLKPGSVGKRRLISHLTQLFFLKKSVPTKDRLQSAVPWRLAAWWTV